VLAAPDVDSPCEDAAAERARGRRGLVERRLVHVAHREVGARARERERGGAADAARRAGDERELAGERAHRTAARKARTSWLKSVGVSKLNPWLPPGIFTSFAPGMLRARRSEFAGETSRSASPVRTSVGDVIRCRRSVALWPITAST